MAKAPLVSIIIETGTRKLAERVSFELMMERYLKEAKSSLPDSQFEILLVGDGLSSQHKIKHCRFLNRPGMGYYGWKNAGAQAARGRYLVYWDSDCRVEPGYLPRALQTFKRNPDVIGLGGLTIYDGNRFFGRLNTVLNFGPHFKCSGRFDRLSVTVNNICLVRKAFPKAPFGPFTGRTGGDSFITQYAAQKGKPFLQDRRLKSYHEDQTGNMRTLLERTLRDLFQPLLKARPSSKIAAYGLALANWPLLQMKRFRRILVFGRAAGLNWIEIFFSPVFILYISTLELGALLSMAFKPRLLLQWLQFQFGKSWVKARGIR